MAREKKSKKTKTTKSPKRRSATKKRTKTAGKKNTTRTGGGQTAPAKSAPRQLKKRTRPAADVYPKPNPTVDEIRDRAYEIYLRRGGEPGDPAADWLQGERELREELAQKQEQQNR